MQHPSNFDPTPRSRRGAFYPWSHGAVLVVLVAARVSAAPVEQAAQNEDRSAVAAGAIATTPSPERLLDAYITALGGQAAQEKLFNRVASGSVELVGLGLKGTFTERSQQPTATQMVMELPGLGRIEAGTDGSAAWETDSIQGARLLEGNERALALRTAALANGAAWRDVFPHVEYAGLDTVAGHACHKVMLTPADGGTETWSLDADTHLLLKTATVIETAMGAVPTETAYEDYRPVDGVLLPFVSVQSLLVQKIRITYDSIRHNADLPSDAFAPPSEVRDLLQAPATTTPADSGATGLAPKDKAPDTP